MINLRKSVTLIALCCSVSLTQAQHISQQLQSNFHTFKSLPTLKNGIAALHVLDAETGKTVFEENSHIGLPTASTLKVITSITALDILGADYQYKTELFYTGHIDEQGILQGDIIIHGTGDPTLGSDRYEQTKSNIIMNRWTEAIAQSGIKAVQGRIIGDDVLYQGNDIPGGWIWTDMGNYYGAGISALNWKENKAGITFRPTGIGQDAPIEKVNMDLSYLKLVNQVTTGKVGSGDNVYAYAAPYSDKIVVKGTYGLDLKKTIEISLPDPALALAYELKKELEQRAIYVAKAPTTTQRIIEDKQPLPKKAKTLAIHTSPRLAEIVYWFNQKSINLYGEALLKSIAYAKDNKTTTAAGAQAVKNYWKNQLGIVSSELDIIDGSGLSPQNNVTTAAMNAIMQYARKQPWFEEFNKSLPLYNQMTMKSGTIGGTLGYTGYHQAKNGKKYTFTLLVYNYASSASTMRQNMFELLNTLK